MILKDVIRQSKSLGVQVKVSKSRRVVARLALIPADIPEWWGGDAVLRFTDKLVDGRVGPEVAVVRLGSIANKAGRAAKGLVRLAIVRPGVTGWCWTECDVD